MARKIRGKWSDVKSSLPDGFHLLVANTNVDDYTYDGVDHGGERVAEEVRPLTLVSSIPCARLSHSIPPFLSRSSRRWRNSNSAD